MIKSLSPRRLHRWLFYAEGLAIIAFVVLAAMFIRRGGAEPESPPISQVETFIETADARFEQQDMVGAVLLYWQALHALEGDARPEQEKRDREGSPTEQHRDREVSPTAGNRDREVSPTGVALHARPEDAPIRVHANLRIAEIYSQSSWLKDAKARLEYAERLDSEHEGVRLLRGKLYRDEGLPAEAAEQFLAVLNKNPDNAEAHYLLGVLYQASKQFKEATTHYAKAIQSDPRLQEIPSEKAPIGILARLQLSRTYSRMLQNYQFLDREFTNEDMAEITRFESQAILLLEEAYAKHPELNEISDDLIRLLFARAAGLEREAETRPYADALEVYERIVQLDPGEVRAWERMGEIYAGFLDDKAAALEMYRKVYELEPHPTVLANIKSLEEDLGNELE